MFITHILRGITSPFTVTSSALYRYPYRNAEEAFRGDAKRISRDISQALAALQGHEPQEARDGQDE